VERTRAQPRIVVAGQPLEIIPFADFRPQQRVDALDVDPRPAPRDPGGDVGIVGGRAHGAEEFALGDAELVEQDRRKSRHLVGALRPGQDGARLVDRARQHIQVE